jgi:hypothetical protein
MDDHFEQLQMIHNNFGTALSRMAGYSDVRQFRKLLDNVSDRLAITPVNNVSDLYEVILQSIHAVKVKG